MKNALIQAIGKHNRTFGKNFEIYCDWDSIEKVSGQWIVKYRTEEQTFETRETRKLGKTLREAIATVRSW